MQLFAVVPDFVENTIFKTQTSREGYRFLLVAIKRNYAAFFNIDFSISIALRDNNQRLCVKTHQLIATLL